MDDNNIFTKWKSAPGIYAILCPGYSPGPGRFPGSGRTLVYLVLGVEKALLFDTGWGNADLKSYAKTITQLPIMVVNSHAHIDHYGGNAQFDVVWIGEHEIDSTNPIIISDEQTMFPLCEEVRKGGNYQFDFLKNGEIINLGGRELEVVEMPGHTKGSIGLLDKKTRLLLSGDAILKRTLLTGGQPISTFKNTLNHVYDEYDFDSMLGAHWLKPLNKDFITKMITLLNHFDSEKVELVKYGIDRDSQFAIYSYGAAFENDDFCAIGYRYEERDIIVQRTHIQIESRYLAMNWDAVLYDDKHQFVPEYGKSLIQFVNINPNQTILDVGCGTGVLTNELSRKGATVIGTDLSENMLQQARENFPHIEFKQIDATLMTFDNRFNTVFSSSVFHWIHDQNRLLSVIYRALKPGGLLVCEFGARNCLRTIWNAFDEAAARHGHVFVSPHYYPTIDEYEQLLLSANFQVEVIQKFIRPTPLKSGNCGLRDFIIQFLPDDAAQLSQSEQNQVFTEMEAKLKPVLWRDDHWIADYVRIQVVARKPVRE